MSLRHLLDCSELKKAVIWDQFSKPRWCGCHGYHHSPTVACEWVCVIVHCDGGAPTPHPPCARVTWDRLPATLSRISSTMDGWSFDFHSLDGWSFDLQIKY